MHRRTKLIIGVSAACLLLFAWSYISFKWAVACCVSQHQEALGREIGMQFFKNSPNDYYIIPAKLPYHVRNTWPMNYELRLREGYKLALYPASSSAPDRVIGYFIAHPDYPFWVKILNSEPKNVELIILHEGLATTTAPASKLAELTHDW